jgi:hypothetical protein
MLVYSSKRKNEKYMKIESRKLSVLEYLQYERDERIPELIESYDGDVEYVINEVWGPLTTVLDGKTDNDLMDIINSIMDKDTYADEFNAFKLHIESDDVEEVDCWLVWETICNPS